MPTKAKSRTRPKPRPRPAAPSPLWTCPRCGRQFVSANKYHTCQSYPLAYHFEGKDPAVRKVYDRLLEAMKGLGPVTAHPLKTRIVFQSATQFAAVTPRRRWLEGCFWLRRRASHPLVRRVEMQVYRDYGHVFRLTAPVEIDEEFVALLREAYDIGNQPLVARR